MKYNIYYKIKQKVIVTSNIYRHESLVVEFHCEQYQKAELKVLIAVNTMKMLHVNNADSVKMLSI